MNQEDYNRRVLIKNTANHYVAFKAKITARDIVLTPMSKMPLEIAEILAQVYAGNMLFIGIDRRGSHAAIYIEDEATRIECNFEDREMKTVQEIVDKQAILDMFSIKTLAAFKKELPKKIITDIEKRLLREIIANGEVNDLNKAKAAAEYLGINL